MRQIKRARTLFLTELTLGGIAFVRVSGDQLQGRHELKDVPYAESMVERDRVTTSGDGRRRKDRAGAADQWTGGGRRAHACSAALGMNANR